MIGKIVRGIVALCPYIPEYNLQDFQIAVSRVLGEYSINEKETSLVEYKSKNAEDYQAYFVAKSVEGLSKRTLKYYMSEIDKFTRFIQKDYDKVTTDDVRYYLGKCQIDNGVTKTTTDNMRRVLSSFFSWLNSEGRTPRNPLKQIKAIKKVKRVKKAFTTAEIERLKTACYKMFDVSRFTNTKDAKLKEIECKRLLALIEVLLSTGARVAELSNLKISDCDFPNRKAIVFGKGAKERSVFFNETAMLRLNEYFEVRKDDMVYVFGNVIKDPKYQNMSIGNMERTLRELGKSAKIDNCHPHKFRRTMATMALKKGMPLFDIQKLLGHASIETTKIYLDLDETSIEASHRKYV